MLRITAIGAGAVNYLLRGCDGLDHAHEMEARADSAELGADRYFARAMEAGEPAGMWLGKGWEALGLHAVEAEMHAGKGADEDTVRAIFGQLRRPESPENAPEFIGRRPHTYQSYGERLAKLQAGEPDASPERARAMEREARAGGNRAVAYYDFTFSPVKSISVLYAAYLAAGLTEQARAVRDAHDQAVKIALAYAEAHVAYTRRGGDGGREYIAGEGLAVVAFAHHTSREHEPQLHTHAAVLNRIATADGRIGALDGKGFRAFKEAIATAYERAVEQKVTEATGLRFQMRPDGVAREVAGMDPELLAEASTRRGQVTRRVGELVEQHRWRTGHEPSAAARKAMAQEATLTTRAAKTGLAGPKAVAAWVDRDGDRRGRLATALADAKQVAGQSPQVVAASLQRIEAAMAAGLADVQDRYATWQIGNLADAIDRHLGDAAALGVPAEQRATALEALARRVLDPAEGFGVVQLSANEAVPVPPGLCRADGQPVWRPHEERRFATAAHLGTEAGVAAFAARADARAPEGAVLPWLERAGLSPDQEAAVVGIMGSGRHGDVLVGPAGTGKSRTVGALAHAWGHTVGGTVYGVATAQIATSNLAGDGLTALNTTRFLGEVTPDPVTGQAGRVLSADDLVVIDEASMVTTAHLAAISTAAARAGAKVVYVGDPHQLAAVEAGGLFTYLAETLPPGQVHALDEPHRFAHPWEAEASLWLRAGDQRAVEAYGDHGRLVAGTVEEMTAAARRGWLADRLDGLDAVLVVGSNHAAAEASAELQEELTGLGRVRGEPLAVLGDENDVRLGDVIEARRNAWNLRVDPSPTGIAEAVINRGRYTVVGVGIDGALLGRDRHGAIAHLPAEYLAEHAALGYASTVHGAEGVSVHAAHGVVDRDATREALYVQATRGGRHNYLYLVTEREPDAHEPQPIHEIAAERLTAVLEVSGAERSAAAVQAADETERVSAPVLLARLDHATRAAADRHLDTVRARLGIDLDADDYATTRLTAAIRAVELGGHDPAVLLDRAIEARGFDDVDSIPGVLAHRIRGGALAADPQQPACDTGAWTDRVRVHGDPELDGYARDVASLVAARQVELADRVAAEAPAWAAARGERPDTALDPHGAAAWRRGAGVTAFYREAAGIDADQVSLGAPPPRERPLERAVYDAALAAAPDTEAQPGGRDWRTEPDAALYAACEMWDREFAQAPEWVAEELMQTSRYARGYHEDAAIERARAETMPEGSTRDGVAEDAARAARFAEQHETRAAELEQAQRARHEWWASSEPARVDAAAAIDELDRRGLPAERVPEDAPAVEQPAEQHRPVTTEQAVQPEQAVAPEQVVESEQAAPEPQVFVREREAREQAAQARAAERIAAAQENASTQQAPQGRLAGGYDLQSLDEEMLIDDEVRGRYLNMLAERRSPERTLDRELDDDLGLGR